MDSGKPYPHHAPGQAVVPRETTAPVLDMPVVEPEIVKVPKTVQKRDKSKNSLVKGIDTVGTEAMEKYNLSGDLGRFLGNPEIKPKESVVVTLDAPQGAMKTRLFFQLMNMYATAGYKVLFLSLEEHPDSALFKDKRDQYLTPQAQQSIDTVGELPNGVKDFHELVSDYDVFFIDSWGKFTKYDKKTDLDNDIRKRYDGKKFFTIYQRTSSGSMRGGAASQFDGDMIMKIHKEEGDYTKNYAYWDKNRYEVEPGLKYYIHSQTLNPSEQSQGISGEPIVLS